MKKTWIVVTVALLGIAVIGGYAVLDHFFPKADPIKCPDIESVTGIILIHNGGSSNAVGPADFGEILRSITNAEPTRKMSINDYPAAKTYYTIEVDIEARKYMYFLYAEKSQVYIEHPYEGIYEASQQFFDFVAGYNKE